VGRRAVVPLTGADVEQLPDPCRSCLFWEQGAACPEPRSGDAVPGGALLGGSASPVRTADRDELVTRKQAWVSASVQDGAPPGRIVLLEDRIVAYALFGPAERFARRSSLVPRLDRDALQLATVWVHPLHRGHGLGRVLVQAAIKEAIRLELGSVQSYGDRRWRERTCVLPVTWLLHEGFEVHHEHPRTPVVRIDTRRTVRWVASLEHAWEEVLGRLPHRAPVPVPELGTRVRSEELERPPG
jgi:GNAT superfamily N-acetyltransferase